MPLANQDVSFLTDIADFFANILRVPGDVMRGWVVMIGTGVAKGIFITLFILLIIWVTTLRKDEVTAVNEKTGKQTNLRPYAIAALASQIVIYLVF